MNCQHLSERVYSVDCAEQMRDSVWIFFRFLIIKQVSRHLVDGYPFSENDIPIADWKNSDLDRCLLQIKCRYKPATSRE